MAKFLALDGSSSTYASTPHSDAVDITGDLTLVARIAPEAWSGNQAIVVKRSGANTQYDFRITGGGFSFGRTDHGLVSARVDAPYSGPEPNKAVWVAVAVDTNEPGVLAAIYVRDGNPGDPWRELVSETLQQDGLGYTTTNPTQIGNQPNGGTPFNGNIYRAQIYSGAGFNLSGGPTGTLVADFNPADAPDYAVGGDSFESALTGETWTLHGNASIGGVRTVISDDIVLQPNLPRPSICIEAVAVTETWMRGQAMRETTFSAVWSREVRSRSNWRQCR